MIDISDDMIDSMDQESHYEMRDIPKPKIPEDVQLRILDELPYLEKAKQSGYDLDQLASSNNGRNDRFENSRGFQ